MAEYVTQEWPFPWMGVVTELYPNHLPPEALASCINMYYLQPFMLRSRGGIDDTYTCGTDPITLMYYWHGDDKLYAADDNAKLYKNGAVVGGTAFDVVDMCSFGVGATPDLIVAENDPAAATLHTYTGAAYAALTGTDVPKCRKVMTRFGRLFGTRNASFPSRLYWSDAGDCTVWSGSYGEGGWKDIAPGEDGEIVDWVDYEGVLYIFKERGIYSVAGDDPVAFVVKKMIATDGNVAGTMADCGQGVLYATKYGVFPLGLPSEAETYDLTRNVEQAIQAILATAKGAYSPELGCYVMVSGATTAWVSHHNNRPDVWTNFTLPQAAGAIYQGNGLWFGGTNGHVYKYDHDDTTDDAATFPVSFKTGNWDLGEKRALKNVRFVKGRLNAAENATATVSLHEDGAGGASHTEALTAGSRNLFKCNLNCTELAMQIAYTALAGPCAFGGAILDIRSKGDVK